MRAALSIMLMQECCNFICQWENEPGGVPLRINHLLHLSAVRYGEIFHEPKARYFTSRRRVKYLAISHADSCNNIYIYSYRPHPLIHFPH